MKRFLMLGLLATVGCASAARHPSLLSTWTPPAGQTCQPRWAPDPLPQLRAVVDSAGFAMAAAQQTGFRPGFVVISLIGDSTGTWTRVAPIESDLPADRQVEFTQLLRRHLRPAGGAWQMRFRVDFNSTIRLRVGAAETCASALRNAPDITRLMNNAAADIPAHGTVVLWIQTNEQGRPREIKVRQSSGVATLDAAAVWIGRQMLFHPALNDRMPLPVWSSIPLSF